MVGYLLLLLVRFILKFFILFDATVNEIVFFLLFFFLFGHVTLEILVSQAGHEPLPLAVNVRSPNHWTAREFP